MEKLLLTPEEASAALGICRSKLYKLLRAGVIESGSGGARQIAREELRTRTIAA